MPINEVDTCCKYVVPKLYSAGWEDTQISDRRSFTDGRIMLVGNRAIRRPQKRADYLLRYRRDFPIAVVEAKAAYRTAGDGLEQAKKCAEILGLKFAYATNGIIEHDSLTGLDNELQAFPKPSKLWARLNELEAEVTPLRRLQAESAVEIDVLLPSVLSLACAGGLNDVVG